MTRTQSRLTCVQCTYLDDSDAEQLFKRSQHSQVLTGGIFNFLVGYFEDGQFEEDVVLIRIEGEGSSGWMDRAQEKRNRQVHVARHYNMTSRLGMK